MLLLDGPLGVPQAEPGSAAGVVAVLPHKVNLFLCECGHRDRFDAMWGCDSAQYPGTGGTHERADRHVDVGGPLLATVEALLVAADADQLAERFQNFIILFLPHHRHGRRRFM